MRYLALLFLAACSDVTAPSPERPQFFDGSLPVRLVPPSDGTGCVNIIGPYNSVVVCGL